MVPLYRQQFSYLNAIYLGGIFHTYKIPIIFIVGVFVVFVLAKLFDYKRKKTIETRLSTVGFLNNESLKTEIVDDLRNFSLLRDPRSPVTSHNAKIYNIFVGFYGKAHWRIFDFQRFHYGQSRSTRFMLTTVAFANSGKNLFPCFVLNRKTIMHQFLEQDARYRGVQFLDRPEFSRKYYVNGTDTEAIRVLFSPEVFSFFEQASDWISLMAEGNKFWYYKFGMVRASDIVLFLKEANTALTLFCK